MGDEPAAARVVRTCCAKCQSDNPRMICSGCKRIKYCSAECQHAHWKVHKGQCFKGPTSADAIATAAIAKASLKNKEITANNRLRTAATMGKLAECERLIDEEGAEVNNIPDNCEGMTCLHCAAEAGHARLVDLLLRRGARRDMILVVTGYVPLHLAAQNGHEGVVQTLLEHGAATDMQISDKCGNIALHLAAMSGHAEVVQLLLRHGAVVDLPKKDGLTPLHFASLYGHASVVEVLLRAGANPLRSCSQDSTPLSLASHKNHHAVVALLQARIAEM